MFHAGIEPSDRNGKRKYSKGVIFINCKIKIMKGIISIFIVLILSMQIEDLFRTSIIEQFGKFVWRGARFIGFLLLWGAVSTVFELIFNKVFKRK